VSGNCGTCRFWQNPWLENAEGRSVAITSEQSARWGVCAIIRHPGQDEAIGAGEWVQLPARSPRAFTADGSGYLSELSTRDDFGCVEWSEKEQSA
jgi:hypothetical protein